MENKVFTDDIVTKKELNKIAEGRNVIMIQVEALQNFVINKTYNGVELTPNINRLIRGDTIYFDHFYTNVGKGNTADAEFSALNSLYPSETRESYTLYEENNFYFCGDVDFSFLHLGG